MRCGLLHGVGAGLTIQPNALTFLEKIQKKCNNFYLLVQINTEKNIEKYWTALPLDHRPIRS